VVCKSYHIRVRTCELGPIFPKAVTFQAIQEKPTASNLLLDTQFTGTIRHTFKCSNRNINSVLFSSGSRLYIEIIIHLQLVETLLFFFSYYCYYYCLVPCPRVVSIISPSGTLLLLFDILYMCVRRCVVGKN
jgi:hypothetical protein